MRQERLLWRTDLGYYDLNWRGRAICPASLSEKAPKSPENRGWRRLSRLVVRVVLNTLAILPVESMSGLSQGKGSFL
jgi:hypothetical protein